MGLARFPGLQVYKLSAFDTHRANPGIAKPKISKSPDLHRSPDAAYYMQILKMNPGKAEDGMD
jgi:hypothetical protein